MRTSGPRTRRWNSDGHTDSRSSRAYRRSSTATARVLMLEQLLLIHVESPVTIVRASAASPRMCASGIENPADATRLPWKNLLMFELPADGRFATTASVCSIHAL